MDRVKSETMGRYGQSSESRTSDAVNKSIVRAGPQPTTMQKIAPTISSEAFFADSSSIPFDTRILITLFISLSWSRFFTAITCSFDILYIPLVLGKQAKQYIWDSIRPLRLPINGYESVCFYLPLAAN